MPWSDAWRFLHPRTLHSRLVGRAEAKLRRIFWVPLHHFLHITKAALPAKKLCKSSPGTRMPSQEQMQSQGPGIEKLLQSTGAEQVRHDVLLYSNGV